MIIIGTIILFIIVMVAIMFGIFRLLDKTGLISNDNSFEGACGDILLTLFSLAISFALTWLIFHPYLISVMWAWFITH